MHDLRCRRRSAPLHGLFHAASFRCRHVMLCMFQPFLGHVQLENNEKALCRSTANYLKILDGKYVDKEPKTLVVSFSEILSTI